MKGNDLKNLVYKILEREPETRNNDMLLMLWVWKETDPTKFFSLPDRPGLYIRSFDLVDMVTPESITRVRRKIQEEGHFPPTRAEVTVRRQKNMERYREFAHTNEFPET